MAINIDTIETVLLDNGFAFAHETAKYKELIHSDSGESVYLNKADPKTYSQLIVHPRHLDQRTQLIGSGRGIGSSSETRFGSNLRKFPEAVNRGAKPSPYGVPFGFESAESLKVFVADVFG
ncbi:hypothetical protein CKO42_24645 [Lamprobacter modestohalophilus]|uniref:Uncharacterized protein n=1 Tax=Lamprobacter modestohalophilus TaxID=1064514 RepID=A0A9X1B784_9GAMM|nr:DUF2002 family protein [Lamprobacter modestohalophilus]MBK1621542.1 hypothetical protein [Lamprobacter modestohalophilus]